MFPGFASEEGWGAVGKTCTLFGGALTCNLLGGVNMEKQGDHLEKKFFKDNCVQLQIQFKERQKEAY